jgi:uridine kinase
LPYEQGKHRLETPKAFRHRRGRGHLFGENNGHRTLGRRGGRRPPGRHHYIRRDHQSFEERAAATYDHPDAFDWELTNRQLHELISGGTVEVPVYDYPNHNRSDEVMVVKSAPIIVFEGILALYDESLRSQFDLKVFVDTDADIRFIRRLQRDVVTRGRTPDSIINQYLTTVRPSHLQFVEPSKRHADVIFPEGGRNDAAFDVLLARVRELLG